jgi:hypothetical protein
LTLVESVSQPLRDAGLRELKDMKQLQSLWIGGTAVTTECWREMMKALPKCRIQLADPR